MRLRRRASLLVAFFLLASAAPASAECAWVLWMTSFKISGDKPTLALTEPSEAYTTKAECDLRHTFASWAVQRRVSLYELKELLGHSSLSMVKRYALFAPEHLRAAAAALDGVLAPARAAERHSKETAIQPVEAH